MNYFPNTPIGRFRLVAMIEGISYIFLLFVAMPLKYFAGMPEVVTYNGWIHGILFMLYIYTLISASIDGKWNFKKIFLAFLASIIPFATFALEKKLRAEENSKYVEKGKISA